MTERMIGGRWPSRLVATAAENRLNPRRNAHVVRGSQRLPNNRDFMSTLGILFRTNTFSGLAVSGFTRLSSSSSLPAHPAAA
jgi:hypothetical protein